MRIDILIIFHDDDPQSWLCPNDKAHNTPNIYSYKYMISFRLSKNFNTNKRWSIWTKLGCSDKIFIHILGICCTLIKNMLMMLTVMSTDSPPPRPQDILWGSYNTTIGSWDYQDMGYGRVLSVLCISNWRR